MLNKPDMGFEQIGNPQNLPTWIQSNVTALLERNKLFPSNDSFQKDALAMLTKKASGNGGPHLFEGKGSKILDDFEKAASYYPYSEDYNIILNHSGYYHDLAHLGPKREGPLIFVELGGGGPKTISLLKAIRPDIFVPIDYAVGPLYELMLDVNELNKTGQFGKIKVQPRLLDFNQSSFNLPQAGKIIIAQFGCTLGNMPGFYDEPFPLENFTACFSHYASQMQGPEDRLIISVDHNDNEKEILDCYTGRKHELLGRYYLQRIKDELPVCENFSPGNFKHHTSRNPDNRLLAIGYTTLKTHSFKVGNDTQIWEEGEPIFHTNSYRFTQASVDQIRSLAKPALREVDVLCNSQLKRIHQHIFALS
jgi:uncharacterized SAM-dependent methyltransferase